MKIGIVGTGGVGGYYGRLLVQAGHDVRFIARGAHLQAIRERGLQVKSVHGDFLVSPVRAADKPAEVGPDTAVISFQNGVDAAERIGADMEMT